MGKGEFIALLGPSGAGKTSLFKLLNRLQSASSGKIFFREKPLEAIAVYDLRRQIMLVGQDSRLLGMTAMQALHYPLVLRGMTAAQREAAVAASLEYLQLSTQWLHKTELELSGGQRQQIAIARGLITEPAVLLLDEPTSALDLGAATRILSAIRTQVHERGLSVIMSNHQIELAQSFCDRVLYLERGHLVQNEKADDVNWQSLRERLVEADAQEQEEWGDDESL